MESDFGGSPPSSVGAGDGPPAGWGWVAPFIGMIWPTGDSGETTRRGRGMERGRAPSSGWPKSWGPAPRWEPFGPNRFRKGLPSIGPSPPLTPATTGIVQQCQKIAAQLNSYAAKIDKVHAAILDLLSRICDPMTGIKEVWDILTDEDEDEIKKIADDIRTVVDNFASEVRALESEIAAILQRGRHDRHRRWATTPPSSGINSCTAPISAAPSTRSVNTPRESGARPPDFVKGAVGYQFNPRDVWIRMAIITTWRGGGGRSPLVGLGPDGGIGRRGIVENTRERNVATGTSGKRIPLPPSAKACSTSARC